MDYVCKIRHREKRRDQLVVQLSKGGRKHVPEVLMFTSLVQTALPAKANKVKQV